MPKRRADFKLSLVEDFKRSRNDAELEDTSDDERLQQLSSSERDSPNCIVSSLTNGSKFLRSVDLLSTQSNTEQAQSFSSSLDAALRRAAILERRAAREEREEREEEAMRAAAAVLKAEEEAEADAEEEAIAVAHAHEAARANRVGGRRRLSELDVAEMMADGRLAEPQRMHMMADHTIIGRSLDGHRRHQQTSRRSSIDFTPPLDIMPCPIYGVDVQLRKYVRTDGRQLSHTPVAMAARQNRQKRKEYVKKMEIAYANMQFETQYLRERMSRLQQELKWYKDRWAEHATKCPLLHVGRRQPPPTVALRDGETDMADSLSNHTSPIK